MFKLILFLILFEASLSATIKCPESHYLKEKHACVKCTECVSPNETVIQSCSSSYDTVCGLVVDHIDTTPKLSKKKKVDVHHLEKPSLKPLNIAMNENQNRNTDVNRLNDIRPARVPNKSLKKNSLNTSINAEKVNCKKCDPKSSTKHIKKDLSKFNDSSEEEVFFLGRSSNFKKVHSTHSVEQNKKDIDHSDWLEHLRPVVGNDHQIYVDVENDTKHDPIVLNDNQELRNLNEQADNTHADAKVYAKYPLFDQHASDLLDEDEEFYEINGKKMDHSNHFDDEDEDVEDEDDDDDLDDDVDDDEDLDESTDEEGVYHTYPKIDGGATAIDLRKEDEIEEELQKTSNYLTDNEVNIEPYPDSGTDWQLLILISAASACLLFFVVVNAYLYLQMKKWRNVKQGGLADIEDLSARVNLMQHGSPDMDESSIIRNYMKQLRARADAH